MLRALALVLALAAPPGAAAADAWVSVGAKSFTESVVLAELIAQLARHAGSGADVRQLGGTQAVWKALLRGDIDAYAEYTGTLRQEILGGRSELDLAGLRRVLAGQGVRMSRPFGFNNTYVLGMDKERARELGIGRISDLRRHPELVLGFSNEFMDRVDGWPGLQAAYALPQQRVSGLDHDLAYRGLVGGDIDVIDLYSTDAEIAYYDLAVLADDRAYFPEYKAVLLYRADLDERAPAVARALLALEGAIGETEMVAMNSRAKLDGVHETIVATDFATRVLALDVVARVDTALERLLENTLAHLALVGISLGGAIAVAVPLGIASARRPRLGQGVLAVTGVVQTVPSLAMLVFMIPLLGIGAQPAIAALFAYSLLPIVRNTYAGLHDISDALRESGEALGLPPLARLRLVELPMASRAILAGIKTAAVINVGTATLAALIGAGGYGQPIFTGIRLDDLGLILQGAVPAALLALLVQGAFELAERGLVPKGLRLARGG